MSLAVSPVAKPLRTILIKHKWVLDCFVLLAYFSLVCFTLLHHEPWRDEAISWLISRDSSFTQLLFQCLPYEPHPMAWYLFLFSLSHAGLPFEGLPFVHLGIAFLTVILFFWKAPFPRPVKYAFAFSYYMMSEYAIIVRGYSLTILTLFCVAACYKERFNKPLLYGALVAFLPNTEYLCISMAAGLVVLYGVEIFQRNLLKRMQALGFVIMLTGLLITAWQIIRVPNDCNTIASGNGMNPVVLMAALSRMFLPLLPDIPQGAALFITATVLAGSFFYLLRKPTLIFLMTAAYSGLFYIFLFKSPNVLYLRHYGFLMIFLLFLLWIRDEYPAYEKGVFRFFKNKEKLFSQVYISLMTAITLALSASVQYTYFTHRMDYYLPYSGAKKMAEIIKKIPGSGHTQNAAIVGYPLGRLAAIIAYCPERKFWDPQKRTFGIHTVNKAIPVQDQKLSPREVIIRAGIHFRSIADLLFVFCEPLPFTEEFGYTFRRLYAADKGVWGVGLERFYLYKAVRNEKQKD